jgi:2-aminoadipate transaminase
MGSKYEKLMSAMALAMQPNAIRKLTVLLGRSEIISFAAGAPAAETFPLEELAETAARVVRDRGRHVLQYGPTRGLSKLIEEIAAYLSERGMAGVRTSEILITTGSQQGIDLAARVILDPGDIALVELPSYVGGIIALQNTRAELVGVRQDEHGIDTDELCEKIEVARRAGRRVKCIYTIPNFQNPSGVTLIAERRRELVAIADEYDLLIIEDDPYGELYFKEEASHLIPLAALHPSRVIYLSSFSKILAPGLRLAWLRAPEEIASKIETAKEGADLSSSLLDQAIVLEAIRCGLIRQRLPLIREFYAARCRAMLDALAEHAPKGSSWTKPMGGFFIFVQLDSRIDTTSLLPSAIENGVAYVPGQPFFVDGKGKNTLRLAFSKESPERIAEGVGRLCQTLSHNT